jgi:hydroxyethylthiazole kinase
MPMFAERIEAVRKSVPLVHNITNYVTVHDVANAIIACGGSPIMSDEPDDVEDITSICGALNVNIGTLNARSIQAMVLASARAEQLGHPIVLDPVGAGASRLRTQTASTLLSQRKIACVRGNMSEIKALAAGTSTTRGVDVAADDVVTEKNLDQMVRFVRDFSRASGSIVACSGAIDLVSDAEKTYVISNGHRLMGQITGSGCMLTGITAAYIAANPGNELEAVAACFCMYGLAGKLAAERALDEGVGNATFSNYLIDEVFKMDAATAQRGAIYELV